MCVDTIADGIKESLMFIKVAEPARFHTSYFFFHSRDQEFIWPKGSKRVWPIRAGRGLKDIFTPTDAVLRS